MRRGAVAAERGSAAGRGAGRLVALALLVCVGCAREEPPPGALPDSRPPQVARIQPADGSVVPGWNDAMTLEFDEPIETRQGYDRDFEASPAYRYRVSFGLSTIDVRPQDGWRDGAVYRFRFPPPIGDLLGNETEDAITVTFSTGPPLTDTEVEGRITDRVTGRPVQGARTLFLSRAADSIPYTATADTGGRFRLEALPPGEYEALGFEDLNASRTLERRLEPYDSASFELEGPDARAAVRMRLTEPDTTPPRLVSASARDSLLVELRFDDHLDPEQDFGRADVAIRDTATGRRVPVAARGLTEAGVAPAWETSDDTAPRDGRTPEEEVEPAEGKADTLRAAADTVAGPDTARDAGVDLRRPGAASDTTPLPARVLLVRLTEALEAGAGYRVRADSVRNLRHLYGGGDTLFTYTPAPDTARAPPDTAGAGGVSDTVPEPPGATPDAAGEGRRGAVPDTTRSGRTADPGQSGAGAGGPWAVPLPDRPGRRR